LAISGCCRTGDRHCGVLAGDRRAVSIRRREAGRIYRQIAQTKGEGNFVTRGVFRRSQPTPQTPRGTVLSFSAAAAREGIPVATVAPKFTGEFLKGIDYVGTASGSPGNSRRIWPVLAFSRQTFGLPATLKLSIHSAATSSRFTQ